MTHRSFLNIFRVLSIQCKDSILRTNIQRSIVVMVEARTESVVYGESLVT
jgi:hypothetical protein